MKSTAIRAQFIDFFKQQQHRHVPAAPLLNQGDPQLLFINAGMNPFKRIFLGYESPAAQRVVNSQPCLRVAGKHNDLEEVGHDTYHHTLFEMLGNWSFGDYFKAEAINWAWKLLTEVYQLPVEQLYATVFEGNPAQGLPPDKEAYTLWQGYLPPERILYASSKDNFWEMGPTGPCGPCTELHIDLRTPQERQASPGQAWVNQDHPQVVELWNLVFIQYERTVEGALHKLPRPYVDTGMGLERLAMALQGQQSTYDTDLFQPIIAAAAKQAGVTYGYQATADVALRVVADHVRAIGLAMADGALPSNQKAGYVVRRLLRRAVRYGYAHLGLTSPFLHDLLPVFCKSLGGFYPQLEEQLAFLESFVLEEEQAFLKRLGQGLGRLDLLLKESLTQERPINGAAVFELYDTYGFPYDLTSLMAREQGGRIDQAGFEQAMAAQKARSRKAATLEEGAWHILHEGGQTVFVGYDQAQATTKLLQYRAVKKQGQTYYQLVFAQTPFYPQGGGQVGDQGTLRMGQEQLPIVDTQRENTLIVHYTRQLPQELTAPCLLCVDPMWRLNTQAHHTATHLLQAALRRVLGRHVQQKGSLVSPELLRFDFTHHQSLTAEQHREVEALVNSQIRANLPLEEAREIPLAEARAQGAMALFGEQYAERVRMITFGADFSRELCGGIHAPSTGALGLLKITASSGIAASVRRLEAMAGAPAEAWVSASLGTLGALRKLFPGGQDLVQTATRWQAAYRTLEQKHKALHQHQLSAQAKALARDFFAHGEHQVGLAHITLHEREDLKHLALMLTGEHERLLLVLVGTLAGKAHLVVACSPALKAQYNANTWVRALAPCIGGRGGGQAHLAQAAGPRVAGLDDLLTQAKGLL